MGEKKKSVSVENTELELLNKTVEKVRKAQRIYATYSQEQVDKIFRAAAIAASQNRITLAKMAV